MAVDDNGIDPAAKDGEPDENELERRRKKKEKDDKADASVEAEMAGKRGAPIDGQPDPEPEDEATLFPQGTVSGDHKVTIKNIVPGGKERKLEAKMSATAIPMEHGLVRYGELVRLLVTVEAGGVGEVPDLKGKQGSGQRTLSGVKDVQNFAPVHVTSGEGLFSLKQILEILDVDFGIKHEDPRVIAAFGAEEVAAA